MTLEMEIWQVLLNDISSFAEIADLLEIGERIWQRGWAEANAGNVSIRLPDDLISKNISIFNRILGSGSYDLNQTADRYYWILVSATGSRYREFNKKGFDNFVLAAISLETLSSSDSDQVVYFPDTRKPTSEWPVHSILHNMMRRLQPEKRIILHAHPTDWIVLSNTDKYRTGRVKLEKMIRSNLPEIDIYLPQGIDLLAFSPPGSEELAQKTLESAYQNCVIIWERHGVVVIADKINTAFDYLEIISKGASVLLKINNLKL
jgi:rhamnulose-1-phosphate aldolase